MTPNKVTQKDIAKVFNDEIEKLGEVKIFHKNPIKKLFQRFRLLPKARTLYIKGLTAGTIERIKVEVCDMNISISPSLSLQDQVNHMMRDNLPIVCKIIAIASHNSPTPIPVNLAEDIANSWSITQLDNAMTIVYGRLDVQTFFTILDLIKGLNLIDTQDQTPLGQPLPTAQ